MAIYGDSLAVGLRRQVDRGTDVVCLLRLLREIQGSPTSVTREWFLKHGDAHRLVAEHVFDRFSGRKRRHVAAQAVRKHRRELENALAVAARWANKRVAHHDEKLTQPPPTYDQLHRALDVLEQITLDYLQLLGERRPDSLLPRRQYNWRRIFQFAWSE